MTAGSLGKKAAKIDAVSGAILSVFQLVPLVGSTVSGLSKVNKLQGKYLRACSFGHLDQSGVLPHTSTRRSPNSLERRVKSLGTRLSEVETVGRDSELNNVDNWNDNCEAKSEAKSPRPLCGLQVDFSLTRNVSYAVR